MGIILEKDTKMSNPMKKGNARYSVRMVRDNIYDPRLKVPIREKLKGQTLFSPDKNVTFAINGLLDQTDMNILIALEAVKRKKFKKDGAVSYVFSIRELQKVLGISSKTNHKWIKEKLEYLKSRTVIISIINNNKEVKINTSILRKWGYATELKNLQDKRGKTVFGDNALFFITIENEFASVIEKDLHVYINNDSYKKLIGIRNGYAQMIIKFLLTQKANEEYKIGLDKALEKIGVTPDKIDSESSYRQIKNRTRKHIKKYGKNFNITIDENDIIHYIRTNTVFHDSTNLRNLPEIKNIISRKTE